MKKVFILLMLCGSFVFSQSPQMDSLSALLKTAKTDSVRAKLLNNLSEICAEEDILKYAEPALAFSEKANYKKGAAAALNNLGYVYNNNGQIEKAIEYFLRALKLQEEIGDKPGTAYSLNNIAFIYNDQGQVSKALEYYAKAVKIAEETKNEWQRAFILDNIGTIFSNKRQYQKALQYHFQALDIRKKINNANSLNSLASSYDYIGIIYHFTDSLDKSLEYYNKALEIWEKTNNKQGLASAYNNIGHIYLKRKDYVKAAAYAEKSDAMGREIGFPNHIKDAHGLWYKADSAMGKYQSALGHYMKYIFYKDSIINTQIQNTAIKKRMEYEFEKKEAVVTAEHKKELEDQQLIAAEKNKKQQIITWSVAFGLLLVTFFAIYIFRSLKLTKEQKGIIEIKNLETQKQKEIIEEKQKEIIDSIHYAKRIQTALITSEKYIDKNLKKLTEKD